LLLLGRLDLGVRASKTPTHVRARLTATMEAALKKPEVRRKLEEQDIIVTWATPAEMLAMDASRGRRCGCCGSWRI
jgi:tripartite-type tricarboxylate transporter receptor subunit TctC